MSISENTRDLEHGMDALVFHGRTMRMLAGLRASVLLAVFFAITAPLMLVQLVLVRLKQPQAKTLPHSYHKLVCRLLGIRVHLTGRVEADKPVLLISNHISWLDIPALSAVAPLSFVSKSETATWPFIGQLAKLQRSVFVDRKRRTTLKNTAGEIAARLAEGDNVVLFAEGTSSDGNRVLPFRSSLFSAASFAPAAADSSDPVAVVQTVAIAYTHLHGLPILRHERPLIAFYGEMQMLSHVWNVLKSGPLDVTISISEPVPLASLTGRKELAAFSEARVRRDFIEKLTSRPRAA